ncbi:MAG: PRC-barrel domain containing protein [Gaiellaceae bacterium]
MQEVWTYREKSALGSNAMDTRVDLTGFKVEAIDGSIGKVDEATYDMDRSYLVVDTGPWIFGKKVLLPAGVVRGIDEDAEVIFVNRTKDEIKNAPELEESLTGDESYRSALGSYYGPGGMGYRDWDDTV